MIVRRAWLAFAASFLFGTAFGWWSFRWYERRPKTSADHYQRVLNHLSEKLSLTPSEKTQVASVLEAERVRVEAVRTDAEGRMKQIHAETFAGMRRLLDPGQQKKLDEQEARFQARMKDRPDNWRLP